jgi:heterodisulfide reductase subunit B
MKVSYYPGCSLDGTAREYKESLEAVATFLDVELEELPDWTCCGASSAHVKDDQLAVSLAARNLMIADRTGMDLMVPCAACYLRLKVAEKELKSGRQVDGLPGKYGGNFHIKHSADFFWELTGEKALRAKVKKPLEGLNLVCYYGCLTTRPPKVTDASNPEDPQSMDEIMNNLGASVKNWSFKTDCCGGSLILSHPEIARTLIRKLLDMAEEAGADGIVAGCPMCQSNLDTRQKELSAEGGKKYATPIFYFTELMGLAFGNPGVKKWLNRHLTDSTSILRQKGLLQEKRA